MRIEKLLPAVAAAILLVQPCAARAESEGGNLPHAGNDIRDTASLQRGARNFMNYCSGCHSAQFVRYNRVAADLGIPEAQLKANLMFTSERPYDTIRSSLAVDDARKWFGNPPPDLSLMARARGTDYLYAFLRGFYADPTRPRGVNNVMLPGVAMPHVLADLQGVQKAVFKPAPADEPGAKPEIDRLELDSPGKLSPEAYDAFVRDTVNFLEYIGEPVAVHRRDLGVWVTLFLLVFVAFSFMLKREYFRDIH
jgi:ubiquinol-cytochrome c reductase cytochrome c1 subunit